MPKENLFRKVGRALSNLEYDYDLAYASPEFCVHLIISNNAKVFTKILRKLQTSNQQWIFDFVYTFKGLLTLLFCLDKICMRKTTSLLNSLLLLKCLSCIKEIMNSKDGMDGIISLADEDSSCIQILAKACSNTNQLVKKEVFQILSGIAMYSEKGYSTCLLIFEGIKKKNSHTSRFTTILDELKNNSNQQSGIYLTVLVGFINCLISQPALLRKRLQMRFEFQSLKIISVFNDLKKLPIDDLLIQIDQYEKSQVEDEREAFGKNGFDLNNLNDVFNAIYVKNQNSAISNQKFLELLQLILFNMEDENSTSVSVFNRAKEKEKKNSDREKTWNILIETVREIMFKNKKLRNIFNDCSTQTDIKIEMAPFKRTTIIRDYDPNYKPIPVVMTQTTETANDASAIVQIEPVDNDVETISIDPNESMPSMLLSLLTKTFGVMFQKAFIAIIDFIQDITKPKKIETNILNVDCADSSTQTNFLNHINIDLKNKVKKSDNAAKAAPVQIKPIETKKKVEPLEGGFEFLDELINQKSKPLPVPTNFKYSSQTTQVYQSPTPTQPHPLASLFSNGIQRRKSPSPPDQSRESKAHLPRSHMSLKDKDFAASLSNIKLRKVGDSNKNPVPPVEPKQEVALKNMSGPPLPPPPPPPPPMPFSLLAQILNPNASFPRSTSVPPEAPAWKEDDIELELNDHRKLIYDLIPKPSRQLKICSWQKLPKNTLNNVKSVWREVNNRQDEISLNYSQLEELFVKTNKVVHRRSSVSLGSTDQLDRLSDDIRTYGKFVTVLDPKYNLNLTVFLKKIKQPIGEYISLILSGKSKEIGIDNLSCLQKILPAKKDIEKVQTFCKQGENAMEKFGKAEQFVKLLSDVPYFELRINLMNFLEEFDEMYDRLENALRAYIQTSEVLLKNESLKLIFGLILATGNFLNMNSWCGQAVGFRIDLLTKLSDVKTNKPSITLLHVIVEQFEKMANNKTISTENTNSPDRGFEFLEELTNLKLIISVGMSNLNADYQNLKKNTIEFLTKLRNEDTPVDVRSQFLDHFRKFNTKIRTLTDLINKIENYKLEIIDYYSEDPQTFNYDDFFKIFHDFCNNIIRAREENKNRITNEDRIAKRKQKLDELKKKSSNLANLANEKDSVKKENVLNGILANIKSGKVLRKTSKTEA